ncbi:hypothetical protein B0I35DRAFT_415257 [Stachybotrys elegans]|uniref:Uncharacterized protein n=1 Tax=Stachybotrys elegans TaxID=80388 RepID=A0A8K0SD65_9HYPO|nr:hypothetical protein B0I35DRAFT_415257 [Stachybotrys elegans]
MASNWANHTAANNALAGNYQFYWKNMDKIRIKIPQNATEFQKQRVQALKDFVRQYLQGKNHKAIRDRLEAKAVHLFSMDTRVPIHLAEAERMFGFTWAGWVVLRIQFGTYNMAWSWTGSQYQAAFPGEDLTKPMPKTKEKLKSLSEDLGEVQARFSAFMDGMQAMSRQSGSRKSGGGQPPAKRQRAEKE